MMINKSQKQLFQILAGKEELNKIKSSTESSLFDKVAMCIGDLGENMALRRGVFLRADDNTSLCYYAHPKGKPCNTSIYLTHIFVAC